MSGVASVQVIGAGLIGTSIALGLREHGVEVHVDDVDPEHVRVAVDRGAGFAGRAQRPELVIVAVPPAAVPAAVVGALTEWPNAVVTDVASVKGPVASAVAGSPEADRYVGSHPMAGRERSGPVAASARLCEGNPWVVVPLAESSPTAIAMVESVATVLGAAPRVMDAETHDLAVALVSHAPQVISALMAARLGDAPPEHVQLAGPGVRDVTRIAASDGAMWLDILSGNAAKVRAVLELVRRDLDAAIDALDTDPTRISGVLDAGRVGTRAIPSKHGDQAVAWTIVYVVVPDQPRALEQMVVDAGQSGVNIEDLRIQHELGRPAGVVEIHVLPESAETLVNALVNRGWPAYL
jgi:prephenate dehydrogenase